MRSSIGFFFKIYFLLLLFLQRYPTTFEDVDALVNYVRKTYVDYEPEVLDDEDDEDE